MSRALTSALTLALIALPLVADEPKKSETAKPQTTTTAAPAPEDSPLVAASKRMNRLGRKPKSKILITNDTLKQAGGNAHITTADQQNAINLPPPAPAPNPTPEMVAAKKTEERRKAETKAADAKNKAEETRRARIATAWEAAEEEFPDDVDPAQAERELQDSYAPPKQESKKPPQT